MMDRLFAKREYYILSPVKIQYAKAFIICSKVNIALLRPDLPDSQRVIDEICNWFKDNSFYIPAKCYTIF